MPSKMHQMIIGLLGRRMRQKGYQIVAFDGKEYVFDGQILPVPPLVGRYRPDLLGYKPETKDVCIGEAKTSRDLHSQHTRAQILEYSSTRTLSTGRPIEIIIGIPRSAEGDLVLLLTKMGLLGRDNISYVWLPEVLVGDEH